MLFLDLATVVQETGITTVYTHASVQCICTHTCRDATETHESGKQSNVVQCYLVFFRRETSDDKTH